VDHLQQERLAAGDAEALEVQGRGAGLQVEGRGDGLAGRLGPGGQQAGLRVEAAALHLLREAQGVRGADVEAGLEDERPAAARALEALLAGELIEGPPDRDQAAAIAGRQLALGREAVARLPLPRVERGLQVELDLVVQRDGPGIQS
jgi:hypothetical protein